MFKTRCHHVLLEEKKSCKIMTFCKKLDDCLLGGIISYMITEICGQSGSGKTQMCLELSITVQFPNQVGRVGGKALYIDTNQDFNPERLKEMADGMQDRHHNILGNANPQTSRTARVDTATMLQNVSYVYCAGHVQLMATVSNLKNLLKYDNKLKLIIIDSFSFPFRFLYDLSNRTRIIYEVLTELQILALEYNIAIVITNELHTRINGNYSKVCPALGDSFAHKVNQRITLSKDKDVGRYIAVVEKSVVSPKVSVPFMINQSGIRGFPD